MAAAVVLDYAAAPFLGLEGLTDSKLLTLEAREAMYPRVLRSAARVSWVACSPATIDEGVCTGAISLRSGRALESLEDEYRLAVVDGFDLKRPELRARGDRGGRLQERRRGRRLGGGQGGAGPAHEGAGVPAPRVRLRGARGLRHRPAQRGASEARPCPLHRLSFQGVGTQQLELLGE